jgi:hypothetical protein
MASWRRVRAAAFLAAVGGTIGIVYPAFATASSGPSAPSGSVMTPAATLNVAPATRVTMTNNVTAANTATQQASPAPLSPAGSAALAAMKQQSASAPVGARTAFAPSTNSTTTASGRFAAASECDGDGNSFGCWYPPDVNAAVGSTQIVEVVNNAVEVFKKSTARTLLAETSLNTLMLGYVTEPLFDPRVLWDPFYNRWIISATSFPDGSCNQYQWLAFSTSADATKPWFVTYVNMAGADGQGCGGFWDYPQIGQNQDAVTVTANVFTSSSYLGAATFNVPKYSVYQGGGWTSWFYQHLPGTTTPTNVIDNNFYAYELEAPVGGSSFGLYYWSVPGHMLYSYMYAATYPISVPSFAVPPNAAQPGTDIQVDTLDGRFVSDPVQIGSNIWATQTVGVRGYPTIRWYEFGAYSSSLEQTNDAYWSRYSDDWNSAIAVDSSGNAMLEWTTSQVAGGTVYPSIAVEGRLSGDAANTMSAPIKAFAGTLSETSNGTPSRWGDTSSIQADYQNPGAFWWANETVLASTPASSPGWGTEIGRSTIGP